MALPTPHLYVPVCRMALHHTSPLNCEYSSAPPRVERPRSSMTAIHVAPLFPYTRGGFFFTLGFPLDKMPATCFASARSADHSRVCRFSGEPRGVGFEKAEEGLQQEEPGRGGHTINSRTTPISDRHLIEDGNQCVLFCFSQRKCTKVFVMFRNSSKSLLFSSLANFELALYQAWIRGREGSPFLHSRTRWHVKFERRMNVKTKLLCILVYCCSLHAYF